MILVQTRTGQVIVNENEYRNINFNREISTVFMYRKNENPELIAQIGDKPEIISDVETFSYMSNNHDAFVQFDSSKVANLKEELDRILKHNELLRGHVFKYQDKYGLLDE